MIDVLRKISKNGIIVLIVQNRGKFSIKKKHLTFDEDRKKMFLKDRRSEINGPGNGSNVIKNVDSSVNYYYLAPHEMVPALIAALLKHRIEETG